MRNQELYISMGISLAVLFSLLSIGYGFVPFRDFGNSEFINFVGSGCKLRVTGSLSSIPPLFIDPRKGGFVRSSNTRGDIYFNAGEQMLLACPGQRNKLTIPGSNNQELLATCVQDVYFAINGKQFNITQVKCAKWPSAVQTVVGRCLGNNLMLHSGFKLSKGFVHLMDICHDEKIHRTLYTKSVLTREAVAFQKYVVRPRWSSEGLFKNIDLERLFSRKSQVNVVGKLLGSQELGNKYIHFNTDFYLARGHMTAKADFFYGTQQMATFHYSNAAPQWQTSNGKNWMALEQDVRKLASKLNEDLISYTGTHGIDTLPDIRGKMVPLSIDGRGNYPVPRMFWKILESPLRNLGIVFVQFNSPYVSEREIGNEMLCKDVCNQVKWLTWDQFNITKGYSYCCEVGDFLKRVKNAPNVTVSGLLK